MTLGELGFFLTTFSGEIPFLCLRMSGIIKIGLICRMSSIVLPNFSARDAAITQRPTATAILAIDSEDRFRDYIDERRALPPGTINRSPYDFTIQKDEPLLNGAFTRIGVNEIVFPWLVPNINRKTNQIRVSSLNGGVPDARTITLTEAFYTPADLAAALQLAIRAIPGMGAFTLTYGVNLANQALPVFVYATNNPAAFISFEPMAANSSTYPFGTSSKQLFDMLGFSDANTVLTNLPTPSKMTLCQAIRYIDIVSTQLTANQAVRDSMSQPISRTILARLYVNGAPGEQSTVKCSAPEFCPAGCAPTTIYRDYSQAKQIQWMPNCPVGGYLRFEVFDDSGDNLINSFSFYPGADNANWSMTLLATEN